MVGVGRIELPTPAMSTQCSTTELYARTIPGCPRCGRQARHLASRLCSDKRLRAEVRFRLFVFKDAVDFEHQGLEMEGLGQHLGARSLAAGLQSDCGESSDEHHPSARADLGAALGQLDTVHLGHDDV